MRAEGREMVKIVMMFLATVTAFGQVAPKPKTYPVTYTVMECPKGMTLWARYQDGWKGLGDGSNVIQMFYKWGHWDGRTQLWDGVNSTPTCFKHPPLPDAIGVAPKGATR